MNFDRLSVTDATIRLEDLRRFERAYDDDHDRYFLRYPTVTASEVASVLSDADLLGELVRRGVLKQADADLLWEEADRVSTYDKHGGMGAAGL